jgi:sialic acid synthase SpsE
MSKIDFIAEVSSNHNNDLSRMKEFIHASKEIGCTGIKFQLFKIDELFSKEILQKSEMHRNRRAWELREEYIPELAELSNKLDLKFSCTPFHLEAVSFLEPFVAFYKIASYELLWLDLFKKCGATGKPIVFSTGMATINEVKSAARCILKTKTKQITILHCNSAYPTPIENANLAGIKILEQFATSLRKTEPISVEIGYSDHTVSPAVIYRAIHHYGMNFIEFHLDLDGSGDEYKAGHCWLPNQMSEVIKNVEFGFVADGIEGFGPSPSELPDREWRSDPKDGLRPIKTIRGSFDG